jgi:hypothetical protein
MMPENGLMLSLQRLKNLTYRVLGRLEFFPFTLLYVLLNAALKLILLRLGRGLVRAGAVKGEVMLLPRDLMLWFGRIVPRPPGHQFDVCLRLPKDAAEANLQDVFSVALTFPHIRSIGLYWDSPSLADDLALLKSRQGRNDPVVYATLCEEIGSRGSTQLLEFLHADHEEFALPVAAARDGQTLLKRQVGAAHVVCLNVPTELRPLVDAVAESRPEIRFFHFSPELPESPRVTNNHSFFGCGFTLHERMALVRAADAYIGGFDELGCTALILGRPAILLGGSAGDQPDRIRRGEIAVWFPAPVEPAALRNAVVEFLSHHFAPGRK